MEAAVDEGFNSVNPFTLTHGAVNNGVLDISINDFTSLLNGLEQSQNASLEHFRFYHRVHHNSETNDNISDWRSEYIEKERIVIPSELVRSGKLKNGCFHVRVPVLLYEYQLEFYLELHLDDSFIHLSKMYTVNAPSFLIYTNFAINDTVLFKPDGKWYTGTGRVNDILDDGYYRIMYWQYVPERGPRGNPVAWERNLEKIHESRVFRERYFL